LIDRKHVKNLLALFFSAFGFTWSVWQHEIMMMPYMAERWNSSFQFFTGIIVPWGAAYDLTLLLEALCFIVALCSIWFWN
jgi:hypothetical protein